MSKHYQALQSDAPNVIYHPRIHALYTHSPQRWQNNENEHQEKREDKETAKAVSKTDIHHHCSSTP